jgi:dipeptidyl aminopeptidase/acylaminoacyl peptidase
MDRKYIHLESRTNLLGLNPTKDMIKKYSPNLHIKNTSPKTFIVAANDDPDVPVLNSVLYYTGLSEAGVEGELHIFKDGKHGFGIERIQQLPGAGWPNLCQEWMIRIGMLN